LPVIPVNEVVDKKIIIGKRRTEEEERHSGSLTPKNREYFLENVSSIYAGLPDGILSNLGK
jgi:hypothetical protein